MPKPLSCVVFATALLILGVSQASFAQVTLSDDGWEVPVEITAPRDLPHWSNELLDPHGTSRLHAVTRATFTDGSSVFSDQSLWSIEISGRVKLFEGVALSVLVPIGLRHFGARTDVEGFFGNLPVGFSIGHIVPIQSGVGFLLAGGLDVYLPTSSRGVTPRAALGRMGAAAVRAYEPQLYVPQLFSGRLRFQAGLVYEMLTAQFEIGVVPGVTVGEEQDGVLLLGLGGRISARVGPVVEVFTEFGASRQIAGIGEISPPFMVSPGVRFHIAQFFDPAVFASLNFDYGQVFLFGLDLGGAFREDPRTRRKRELRREADWRG